MAARNQRSTLADQSVWDEMTDEERESLRRLTRDGLGPAKDLVTCEDCGSSDVRLTAKCARCRS